MNNVTVNKEVCELIEKAKEYSKNRFLFFAKKFYQTDENLWNHLWKIPIVPTYKNEVIFPVNLDSISRENVVNHLNRCIKSQIGSEYAVFLPYETLLDGAPMTLLEEYTQKVKDGKVNEEYDAVIVYNEKMLQKDYSDIYIEGLFNIPPLTYEKINQRFLNSVSEIFLHELIHLNTQALVIDETNPDRIELLNGAHLNGYDEYTPQKIKNNQDDNEVLLDTLARLINISSRLNTIEDGLYEIVKFRGDSSSYDKFDDTTALLIFTLFPDEISKWLMFEAYDDYHHNLYEEKYNQVFGKTKENGELPISEKLRKAGEYFNTTISSISIESNKLQKRKEILKMLGVKNINFHPTQIIDFNNSQNSKILKYTDLDER